MRVEYNVWNWFNPNSHICWVLKASQRASDWCMKIRAYRADGITPIISWMFPDCWCKS